MRKQGDVEGLVSLLKEGKPRHQRKAGQALLDLLEKGGTARVIAGVLASEIPFLVSTLEHGDSWLREFAVIFLRLVAPLKPREFFERGAARGLMKAMGDQNARLQAQAVWTLAKLATQGEAERLLELGILGKLKTLANSREELAEHPVPGFLANLVKEGHVNEVVKSGILREMVWMVSEGLNPIWKSTFELLEVLVVAGAHQAVIDAGMVPALTRSSWDFGVEEKRMVWLLTELVEHGKLDERTTMGLLETYMILLLGKYNDDEDKLSSLATFSEYGNLEERRFLGVLVKVNSLEEDSLLWEEFGNWYRRSAKLEGYHRIQAWIDTRVPNLARMTEREQHHRLLGLVKDERKGLGMPEGSRYDWVAGLQAYVETNAYRKLLKGGSKVTSVSGRNAANPGLPERERHQKQAKQHRTAGYQRLQAWVDVRVPGLKGMSEEERHRQLLRLVEDERKRNAKETPWVSLKGLESYVQTNAYRVMLGAPVKPEPVSLEPPSTANIDIGISETLQKIGEASSEEQPEMVCPNCGKGIKSAWKVCQFCMFELEG
jgi:hypothetical protein